MGGFRAAFFSDCSFFALRRFSLASFDGRFFFLTFGTCVATSNNKKKRFTTSSLFLCWLRDVCEERCNTPSFVSLCPSLAARRLTSSSVKASVSRKDQLNATLELVLFACCPPGPLLFVALNDSSCKSCSLLCTVFISSAALAAVYHLFPVFFPLFAPGKWSLANGTIFCGEVSFFHVSVLFILFF